TSRTDSGKPCWARRADPTTAGFWPDSSESDSVASGPAGAASLAAYFVDDDPMDGALNFSIEECERARIVRDPAYDGRFFIGVRTTRIYCRPVCPARPAKPENVRFYPSAAAAEAAGFRPCLRCRPETAPFSPAWKGSLATVERAVRLIEQGALDST